jgi:hypothetical protein
MPSSQRTGRLPAGLGRAGWVLAGVLAIPISMVWLDRPAALFFFRTIGRYDPRYGLHHLLLPVAGVLALALLLAALRLPQTRMRVTVPLLCVAAAALAEALSIALKWIVGRSPADPVFLLQHGYGFHPFHPCHVWNAFPSATAAVVCASFVVLARALPHLARPLAATLGMLCLWLLVANAHWLSDLIAGVLLGWACGGMVNRLGGRFLIRLRAPCV